jgi:hypothetical protein
MKAVKYFNNTIIVPSWVTHIAIDEDGVVNGYDAVPDFIPSFSVHLGNWAPTGDRFVKLASTPVSGGELIPSKTLRKV